MFIITDKLFLLDEFPPHIDVDIHLLILIILLTPLYGLLLF